MTKHVKKEHPDELKRSTRQMYNDIVRSGAKRKLYGNQYLSNRPPEKAFKKVCFLLPLPCGSCGGQAYMNKSKKKRSYPCMRSLVEVKSKANGALK